MELVPWIWCRPFLEHCRNYIWVAYLDYSWITVTSMDWTWLGRIL